MVKAIMHGCNGHMGRVITDIIKNTEGIELVAGIDKYTKVPNEYPVFENIGACDVEADVIIDFSNAAAADELLGYCVEKQVPVVLCTTGLSEEQLAKVEESAKKVAVLKSANMSLGINLLLKILQDATKVLSPAGYDIELVEKHHNQKLDAQAVLHLRWLILSMKQRIISIIMYMIEARCARNATEKKSEFQLYAEERSLEIMRCSLQGRMK